MNKSNKPQFIIIGAMKCATTTLHDQLANQEGIHMSNPKEPNFFSDDVNYNKSIEWYQSLFCGANEADICGESSTHYTKFPTYPECARRIHLYNPDIKLIYVVRHPIDRLVSQYIHEWSQDIINTNLELAIETHYELISYSKYAMQLMPYLEFFPRENIYVLFFERLCLNPVDQLRKICNFIGHKKPFFWDNEISQRNNSSLRIKKSILNSFLVSHPALRYIRKNFIPKIVREYIASLYSIRQKPKICDTTRSQLVQIFDADLSIFGKWFDLEINCSNYHQVARSKELKWSLDGG